MKNSLQRVWEQASIYLPVLLMALLAVATWWLVRNAPKPLHVSADQVASAEPDYALQDFSVMQFDAAGRLESEMLGKAARHYPTTDTLEIDEVRTRSLALDGTVTTTSGQRGISNSDASEVQLWGNAQVQRTSPTNEQSLMRVEGEFLHAWTNEERVQSHLPVILTRANSRFAGDSMEYDNLSQVIQLKGRVRGFIDGK
ncbi:MAG: LPS export ABC transporter periplasmic protein LptC [Comamonas sp.]|nr:LPS export ABC transporter periplasmic protein LptC [Candidatus Comamonas equi]